MHGNNIVASELSAAGPKTFRSYNPRQGAANGQVFFEAAETEVDRAMMAAEAAAADLRKCSAGQMSAFLLTLREEILALGEDLVIKADEESALGLDRLRGERDRTVNQIKLFADLVTEGSWVEAVIDTALPDRKPLPRVDIRRMLIPIGPVAVFGASNFPLAFSVAGGDTVSAFAAGNPVVVKAHPAHPGTSELVAGAVVRAIEKSSMPRGMFSMLHSLGTEPALALVKHSATKAVGFTGSQRAGRALFDAAGQRPDPIPVFAEMGSVNPIFFLSEALRDNPAVLAEGLFKSVNLSLGQMCTCPGLAFAMEGDGLDEFVGRLTELFRQSVPGTMLNAAIAKGYSQGFERASAVKDVIAHRSPKETNGGATEGQPGVLVTDAATWLKHRELREEIFGPATVVVRCVSQEEALACSRHLEGSLTATVHGSAAELARQRVLLDSLSQKAGRLIINGYPTGVEVGYAMQHGGPYPATTDSRFTSVGAASIVRFARPVCYQNFPQELLPIELHDTNPRGIWRKINGQLTRDAVAAGA